MEQNVPIAKKCTIKIGHSKRYLLNNFRDSILLKIKETIAYYNSQNSGMSLALALI
jgi:hypothetical protein